MKVILPSIKVSKICVYSVLVIVNFYPFPSFSPSLQYFHHVFDAHDPFHMSMDTKDMKWRGMENDINFILRDPDEGRNIYI